MILSWLTQFYHPVRNQQHRRFHMSEQLVHRVPLLWVLSPFPTSDWYPVFRHWASVSMTFAQRLVQYLDWPRWRHHTKRSLVFLKYLFEWSDRIAMITCIARIIQKVSCIDGLSRNEDTMVHHMSSCHKSDRLWFIVIGKRNIRKFSFLFLRHTKVKLY